MKRNFIRFAWAFLGCLALALGVTQCADEPSDISWNSAGKKELEKIVASHKGEVILIDFWASWCGPCRRALPETVGYSKDNKRLVVITVSLDRDPNEGLAFLTKLNANKSINLFWTGGNTIPYGYPNYIPYMVLIDKKGNQHPFSEAKMKELLDAARR